MKPYANGPYNYPFEWGLLPYSWEVLTEIAIPFREKWESPIHRIKDVMRE